MVFLDTSIVVYYVERTPGWGSKASSRLALLRAAGETLALTELVRMECLVGPVKRADDALLGDFTSFFAAPHVAVLSISAAVALRAATIRAKHGFQPMDSIHLAAAVEHGCVSFLTNDLRLTRFPDILVEALT